MVYEPGALSYCYLQGRDKKRRKAQTIEVKRDITIDYVNSKKY